MNRKPDHFFRRLHHLVLNVKRHAAIIIQNGQGPHSAVDHGIFRLRKRYHQLLLFLNGRIIHNPHRNYPFGRILLKDHDSPGRRIVQSLLRRLVGGGILHRHHLIRMTVQLYAQLSRSAHPP